MISTLKIKPYRHLFGGFQLLQSLSVPEAEVRLQKMAKEWALMKKQSPAHMIHVEFGHFSDMAHFRLFETYAVKNADSLGMNEVEIKMLLKEWTTPGSVEE